MAPVTGPISSEFRTPRRPDHDGVDLAAPRGTPVRAAAAGIVTRVRCNVIPASHTCDVDGGVNIGGCGWYVDIQHSPDVTTRYCHLQRQPSVITEDQVTEGQVIGYVGASGHVTGPHLHLEVLLTTPGSDEQTPVDPVQYFAHRSVALGQA
jgi:murein DD-endopeptidase MepM/ murein hydrolase activator NlpD